MPDIKLIVSDLDGTLLDSGKRIPQKNLDAVRFAAAHGARFTICTGRPVSMAQVFVKLADVSVPIIGCNGSLVYDAAAGRVLKSESFERETLAALTEFSLKHGLDYLAYTADTVYHSAVSRRIEVFKAYNTYAAQQGCGPVVMEQIHDGQELLQKDIVKILITELHGQDLRLMSDFLQEFPQVTCAPSMADVLDLTPAGACKGSAVVWLADYLGIAMDAVCVCGDTTNDISMMKAAGYSVCMANGTDDAKQAAGYVTKADNNAAGFAEGILHMWGTEWD